MLIVHTNSFFLDQKIVVAHLKVPGMEHFKMFNNMAANRKSLKLSFHVV
jgi:hypothetical protein